MPTFHIANPFRVLVRREPSVVEVIPAGELSTEDPALVAALRMCLGLAVEVEQQPASPGKKAKKQPASSGDGDGEAGAEAPKED